MKGRAVQIETEANATRIIVNETRMTVCESGHIVKQVPTGRQRPMFVHGCGKWTFEDANFCQWCATRLPKLRWD